MSKIEAGSVVAFHYVLSEGDTQLDDSRERTPMLYLHGASNIVRGLEAAMDGRITGDTFTVTVSPEEGYGVRQGDPMPVPRDRLPEDMPTEPGSSFMTRTPDGRPMMLRVTKADADQIWIDPHHPLAGKTLTYEVEILGIRPATSEEKEVGHPQFGVDDA
jgi:FKBP-type peptidyl-prolyl cis-trans isomerase SlyD